MKFKTSSERLSEALRLVSKAVSSSSTLPILTGVYVSFTEDKVRLVGTDLELGIETYVDAECESSGAVVIPERYLTEIVKRVPKDTVEFSFNQDDRSVTIQSGNAVFNLKTLDPSDFPLFHKLETENAFSLSEKTLKNMIKYTSFAAASNDARKFLTGCYCTFSKDSIAFVSTDAYRLAYIKKEMEIPVSQELSVIIPAKTLNDVERFLEESDDEITISLTDRQIMIEKGDTTFVSRLIDGSYPDYKRIIPTSFITEAEIEKDDLMRSIERASLFVANQSSGIRFEVTSEKLTVSSKLPELGAFSDELPASTKGEDIKVAFKWQYMMDVLRLLSDDHILIKFAGPMKPIYVEETFDGFNYTYLVMPFNINE